MSSRKLTVAVAQSHPLETTAQTLAALTRTTQQAAARGVQLLLFPEAYLGGYPPSGGVRGSGSGSGRARTAAGPEQSLQYFQSAVDLGDTPAGAGDDWVARRLPLPAAAGADGPRPRRGDGTREALEQTARATGVFVVTGVVERAGAGLYGAAVYVCPRHGVLGKRRKVMPTGAERLIWAQGSAATLKAITTRIAGVPVTLAAAIGGENYMPLLRQSLYCQHVQVYLAPTADGRDPWLPLMRTVACEGRTVVLSANRCVRRKRLPSGIRPGPAPLAAATTNSAPAEPEPSSSGSQAVPRDQTQAAPRRGSVVTRTALNHEIIWPARAKSSPDSSLVLDEESPDDVIAGESARAEPRPLAPGSVHGHRSEAGSSRGTGRRRESIVLKTFDDHDVIVAVAAASSLGLGKADHDHESTVAAITAEPQSAAAGNEEDDELRCRGGSCIVNAKGDVVAGPLWGVDVDDGGLLVAEVDLDDCIRGRLDLDLAGSCSRNDSFKLTVDGLDLSPPP
ncbi:MAG: Nitrilase [Phylliscum demangeonii]|nr:MAG: Nitrilase [Phylliscum demangeonii]